MAKSKMGIQLRDFQLESIEAMERYNKGIVCLPTGTGKSFIQAYRILKSIKQREEEGKPAGVYVILSHRILLSMQLMKEVFIQLADNNVKSQYLNVCSGKVNENDFFDILKKLESTNDFYSNIESTLSIDDISEKYQIAQEANTPLIISGTYHSADKIARAKIPIDTVFHDECHFLTTPEFYGVHTVLSPEKQFNFTATHRVSESNSGLGMNNRDLFGDMIYFKSPLEMIMKGEIVKPMLHLVKFDLHHCEHQDGNYESHSYCILESFKKHAEVVEQNSCSAPGTIGAKLLVTCEGQDALLNIMKSKKMAQFLSENTDVKIFAISSDVGAYINGQHSPPSGNIIYGFLSALRALSPSDKAIILHVDMLAEGLDVPGITGVMPFRNCSPIKFIQTLGRACRIHSYDRKRIYNETLAPADFKNYVKPYAWVVLPLFLSNSYDMRERYYNIMLELKTNYGFIPKDQMVVTNGVGVNDIPELVPIKDILEGRKNLGTSIKEFFHHIENTEISNQLFRDTSRFNRMTLSDRKALLRGFTIT